MGGLPVLVITDNVQTAQIWAANNRAPWGSWRSVITPNRLANVPEGSPYVLVGGLRDGAPPEFDAMIQARGLREGGPADFPHPSFT